MLTKLPSARKQARMNRRQRKKLYLGEFQERLFEVRVRFHLPLEEAEFYVFFEKIVRFIESHGLLATGLGGTLPIKETDALITAYKRYSSPTDTDRQAMLDWLRQQPEVADTEVGECVDAWYGWEDAP